MKKFIIIPVLALVASGFLFREPLGEMTEAWATRNMFVPIEAATFQPGPDIGTPLTELQAHHQGRSITTIDEFSRGNGTVLIALRSLDWSDFEATSTLAQGEPPTRLDLTHGCKHSVGS